MLRRTTRYARTLLAVAMLLVWIGLIALWVRSYWRADQIVLASHDSKQQSLREYILISGHGGICLAVRDMNSPHVSSAADKSWETSPDPQYPQPWVTTVGSLNVVLSG